MGSWVALLAMTASLLGACAGPSTRSVHRYRYPDGTRWEVERIGTLPHGDSKTWHPNGARAVEGQYYRGQKHGLFVYWDERGKRTKQVLYERGRVVWEDDGLATVPFDRISALPKDVRTSSDSGARAWVTVGLGMGSSIPMRTEDEPEDEQQTGAPLNLSVAVGVLLSRYLLYAGGDLAGAGDDTTQAFLGLGAGAEWSLRWARIRVAVEAGGHRFGGIGAPKAALKHATAWTSYGGARASMLWTTLPHLWVGIEAFARRDVGTKNHVILFGLIENKEHTWELGGTVAGISLTFLMAPEAWRPPEDTVPLKPASESEAQHVIDARADERDESDDGHDEPAAWWCNQRAETPSDSWCTRDRAACEREAMTCVAQDSASCFDQEEAGAVQTWCYSLMRPCWAARKRAEAARPDSTTPCRPIRWSQ